MYALTLESTRAGQLADKRVLKSLAILSAVVAATPALAGPIDAAPPRAHIAHPAFQVGTASWYGRSQPTASGGRFNPQAMTCAHPTLPLGSVVNVTNLATGKKVAVTVNDRGPYVRGRIVDLSERAAHVLGVGDRGLMVVRLEVVSLGQPVGSG
jgi:rare lipoprotein A